jgi:hypothetical protein
VRSLLLAGAPCSSESTSGLASVHTGATMRQGGVRSGHFLAGAPCSSTAVPTKGSRHGGGDGGDDGFPVEVATMGPSSSGVYSSRFGNLTAAACEGNKNLPTDFRPQAGPEFIGSSISSASMWNCF